MKTDIRKKLELPRQVQKFKKESYSQIQTKAQNQSTSFLLTFNDEQKEAERLKLKKGKLLNISEVTRPGTALQPHNASVSMENLKEHSPFTSILNINIQGSKESRIKKLEEESEKIKKQFRHSSSSKKRPKTSHEYNQYSNQSSPFQKDKQRKQQHSSINIHDRHSERPAISQNRNASPDGNRSSHSKSIDRIVKDNIKKQQSKQKKKLQIMLMQQEKENMRKQQISANNKVIRERNYEKISLKKKKQGQNQKEQIIDKFPVKQERAEEALRLRSKSPLKYFENYRNIDMPLKKPEKKIHKKDHDIGLEIFELKKELGMFGQDKSSISIDKILTERSKKKQKMREMIELQQNIKDQANIEEKKKVNDNKQLKKLIALQQKKRIKELKQKKIMEIMSQQRVLQNLKQLNEMIQQRISIKPSKSNALSKEPTSSHQRSHHFKTVEDIENVDQKRRQIIDLQLQRNRMSVIEHASNSKSKKQQQQQIKIKKINKAPKESVSARKSFIDQPPQMNHKIKLQKPNKQNKKVIYSHISRSSQQKNSQINKSFGKQRNSVSKQKLISKLIKQLQKQQKQQESFRDQLQSRSKSAQRRSSSKKTKSNINSQQVSIDSPQRFRFNNNIKNQQTVPVRSFSPSTKSHQDSPNKINVIPSQNYSVIQVQNQSSDLINNSIQSENIEIDDEMMVFCFLTTAAQIIQKNFRAYMQRKRRKQVQSQIKEEYKHLSESTKLENRILPIQDNQQKQNEQSSSKQQTETKKQDESKEPEEKKFQKKTPKHTFSFGNYDDHHMSQVANPDSFIDFSYNVQNSMAQQQQQQSQDQSNSNRVDSSPAVADSDHPNFINQQLSKQQQQQLLQEYQNQLILSSNINSREQEFQQKSKKDSLATDSINNQLNINDKFKYALRSLAERQKSTNIFDKIKQQQQHKQVKDNNSNISVINQATQQQKIIYKEEQKHKQDLRSELEALYYSKDSKQIDQKMLPKSAESEVNSAQKIVSKEVKNKQDNQNLPLLNVESVRSNPDDEEGLLNFQQEFNNMIEEENKEIEFSRVHLQFSDINQESEVKRQDKESINFEEDDDEEERKSLFHMINESNINESQVQQSIQGGISSSDNDKQLLISEKDNKGSMLQDESSSLMMLEESKDEQRILDENSEIKSERTNEILIREFQIKILEQDSKKQKASQEIQIVHSQKEKENKSEQRLHELEPIILENKLNDVEESLVGLDLSVEEEKENNKNSNRLPELQITEGDVKDIKDESHTGVLDISVEEEDDEYEELKQLQSSITEGDERLNLQVTYEKQVEERKLQEERERLEKAERLTQEIFEDLLKREVKELKVKREKLSDELLKEIDPVKAEKEAKQIEEFKHHQHQYAEEKFVEKNPSQLVKPLPILEATIKELTMQSRPQGRKPLGIDTTDEAIQAYIEEIFNQIRPRKEQFLQAFMTPIYKNPVEILSNLQRLDYGEMEASLDFTNSLAYILNVQLYLTLEKARENLIHEAIEQIKRQTSSSNPNLISEEDMTDLISESQHIHNKIIFDCVNESLNKVRPYGNQGEPMPWSKKPRKNVMFMFESTENLDAILVSVKHTVLSWARTRAGALPPKFYSTDGMFPQQLQIDEEAFAHMREKCLAQLLAQDLIKDEEKWLDYEMEEAQVKIDLSDIILEHLVGETVNILNQIQQSHSSFLSQDEQKQQHISNLSQ